jgi:Co/Zn/Cd efflux system component
MGSDPAFRQSGLLRESLNMSMNAVPQGISTADVRGYLENLPGVAGVHDLHIWAMSTTETALTVRRRSGRRQLLDGRLPRARASLRHPSFYYSDRGR